MAAMLEREIKLRFGSAAGGARGGAGASARRRCAAAGSRTTRCSTPSDEALRRRRCVLRVRREGARSFLTFKGPVQPGPMKLREELETVVADGDVLQRVLERPRPARLVPLPEVPRGVRARRRGRSRSTRRRSARSSKSRAPRRASRRRPPPSGARPADYILDSYCGLFMKYREALGFRGTDMVFDEPDRDHVSERPPPRHAAVRRGRPWSSRPGWARACAPLSRRARQARAAGRRRAARRAHPALARGRRRRRRRAEPAPPAGDDHGGRRRRRRLRRARALLVGTARPRQRRRPAPARCRCSTPTGSSSSTATR